MFFRALNQRDTIMTEPAAVTGESRSLFIDSITLQYVGNPQDLEAASRRILANINPDLTMDSFRTLDHQVAENFTQERLIARLTMLFGLIALVLASVGLYGLTAYSVARRTSEIGVRMAMGATRSNVIGLIMRGAMLQIGIGLLVGIAVALAGGRILSSQLYGVTTYDPYTLLLAVGVLTTCAAIAGLVPARRASSIEPMIALRME
jgi:ABC-type antimicrobial peptide transport system permease subunit